MLRNLKRSAYTPKSKRTEDGGANRNEVIRRSAVTRWTFGVNNNFTLFDNNRNEHVNLFLNILMAINIIFNVVLR